MGDDFTEYILQVPNTDLLSDLSQISDHYEPVSKSKGITSYTYGTSGTSSGSEYEPSDNLLSEVSQISEVYKPVSMRKGMRSYACGTSGTSNGSEYEPSKDSENKT